MAQTGKQSFIPGIKDKVSSSPAQVLNSESFRERGVFARRSPRRAGFGQG